MSCRSQVNDGREKKKGSYDWVPKFVHPAFSLGYITWNAKVEATKESTKATAVRIEREDEGIGGRWRGERRVLLYKLLPFFLPYAMPVQATVKHVKEEFGRH